MHVCVFLCMYVCFSGRGQECCMTNDLYYIPSGTTRLYTHCTSTDINLLSAWLFYPQTRVSEV